MTCGKGRDDLMMQFECECGHNRLVHDHLGCEACDLIDAINRESYLWVARLADERSPE